MVGYTVLIQSPHKTNDWGPAIIVEVEWKGDKNDNLRRTCYFVKILEDNRHIWVPLRRIKRYNPNQVYGV